MNHVSDIDLTVFIACEVSRLTTDSRAVAIAFGKRHDNVLRAIEKRLRSSHPIISGHTPLNFEACSYADSKPEHGSAIHA